ncbi:MAG: WD40 repeat domain-containing protein, partial [Gemmataceae bacterium]|nr:WD40 repeat domain-containing protein [Gemmataceae bacterium]
MLVFEDHRCETAAAVHKSVVYAIAFSPDGSQLATGARDGSVFVRDASGSPVTVIERGPKTPPVHAIGYFPSGNGIVVGGGFGWGGFKPHLDGGGSEGEEGRSPWVACGPQYPVPVTSLAVLNERTVAVGSGDRFKAVGGKLELWDVASDRKLLPYFHEPNGVRAISASPKKKMVAWATGHRKVKVWDITQPSNKAPISQLDCLQREN